MSYVFLLPLIMVVLAASIISEVKSDSLNGKHLRVIPAPVCHKKKDLRMHFTLLLIIHFSFSQINPIMTVERNASGHITRLTGVAQSAFDLLAETLHFT